MISCTLVVTAAAAAAAAAAATVVIIVFLLYIYIYNFGFVFKAQFKSSTNSQIDRDVGSVRVILKDINGRVLYPTREDTGLFANNMFPAGTSYVVPRWGIYRQLDANTAFNPSDWQLFQNVDIWKRDWRISLVCNEQHSKMSRCGRFLRNWTIKLHLINQKWSRQIPLFPLFPNVTAVNQIDNQINNLSQLYRNMIVWSRNHYQILYESFQFTAPRSLSIKLGQQ